MQNGAQIRVCVCIVWAQGHSLKKEKRPSVNTGHDYSEIVLTLRYQSSASTLRSSSLSEVAAATTKA